MKRAIAYLAGVVAEKLDKNPMYVFDNPLVEFKAVGREHDLATARKHLALLNNSADGHLIECEIGRAINQPATIVLPLLRLLRNQVLDPYIVWERGLTNLEIA